MWLWFLSLSRVRFPKPCFWAAHWTCFIQQNTARQPKSQEASSVCTCNFPAPWEHTQASVLGMRGMWTKPSHPISPAQTTLDHPSERLPIPRLVRETTEPELPSQGQHGWPTGSWAEQMLLVLNRWDWRYIVTQHFCDSQLLIYTIRS